MPDKPQAQLIRELSIQVAEVVATSRDWAEYGQRDISRLNEVNTKINDALLDLSKQIAVLEHKVEDLRSGWLERTRQFWAVFGPLFGTVVGAGMVYYLGWRK